MSNDCFIGWSDGGGNCCCNCKYHIKDFHHCTTVKERTECVCSNHKGWICMPPETEKAFSGWAEHGMCEMHRRIISEP